MTIKRLPHIAAVDHDPALQQAAEALWAAARGSLASNPLIDSPHELAGNSMAVAIQSLLHAHTLELRSDEPTKAAADLLSAGLMGVGTGLAGWLSKAPLEVRSALLGFVLTGINGGLAAVARSTPAAGETVQ